MVEAGERVREPKRGGNIPDVVVVENWPLPESPVAVRIRREVEGKAAEVFWIEDGVGVATRDGEVVEFVNASID